MTTASEGTALYRLYDVAGRLLYVGVTDGNPQARFAAHRRTKPWWPQVASHTVERRPTRAEALAAERAAIRTEAPRYNQRSVDTPAVREAQRARGRVAQQGYEIRKKVTAERQAAGAPYEEALQAACEAERAHKEASGLFLAPSRTRVQRRSPALPSFPASSEPAARFGSAGPDGIASDNMPYPRR